MGVEILLAVVLGVHLCVWKSTCTCTFVDIHLYIIDAETHAYVFRRRVYVETQQVYMPLTY